jgi:hypothetical protein
MQILVEARLTVAGQRAALSEKAAFVGFTPAGKVPMGSTTSLRPLFRSIQRSRSRPLSECPSRRYKQ